MKKLKLYLDFDGVILDTINVTYKKLKELNITDEEEILQYYRDIDWDLLLKETDQINDSISNIGKLLDSGLYDVEILTHVNSSLEGELKDNYIKGYFPHMKVNVVFKPTDKCEVVDPKDAILVDDFMGNLDKWNKNGGIAIKFSDNNKTCKFKTVSNLGSLIDMYDDIMTLIK